MERVPLSGDEAPSLQSMLAAIVSLPQHVVFRAFPAETVVLNLDSGKYHSLNPIGGRMLELLDDAPTYREALRRLREEFCAQDPAVVEADLYRFCIDLAARGLIDVKLS